MCRRLFGQLVLFWWCRPGGWTAGLKRGEDMEGAGTERRKYIIGWLTFGPGKRDDFMKLAVPYVATCREEKGCLFFEMNPSVTDPDVVTIAECFESAEAHSAHLRTPWFEAFWAELNHLGLHGRFENIFAGRVEPDSAEFGGREPAHVSY